MSYTSTNDDYLAGYHGAIDEFNNALEAVGNALCMILKALPDKQFTISVHVSDECKLEFTVKKV